MNLRLKFLTQRCGTVGVPRFQAQGDVKHTQLYDCFMNKLW